MLLSTWTWALVRSEGVELALRKWGGLEKGASLKRGLFSNLLCMNGAGGGRGEGRTCLEFLHLGGLLLSKLSGCGKRKMKEAGFPASRVTVCDGERKRQGVREGGGEALLRGAPGNPV